MSGPDRDLENFHFFFSDQTEHEIDSKQGSSAGPRPPDIDYSAGHGTLKHFQFFSPTQKKKSSHHRCSDKGWWQNRVKDTPELQAAHGARHPRGW